MAQQTQDVSLSTADHLREQPTDVLSNVEDAQSPSRTTGYLTKQLVVSWKLKLLDDGFRLPNLATVVGMQVDVAQNCPKTLAVSPIDRNVDPATRTMSAELFRKTFELVASVAKVFIDALVIQVLPNALELVHTVNRLLMESLESMVADTVIAQTVYDLLPLIRSPGPSLDE